MEEEDDQLCHHLAATLSTNYLNTDPYDANNSTLTDYLASHGILLTMCFLSFTSCFLPMHLGADHIAASWINADLGLHVIPVDSQMGLILKPEVAADMIKCMYPTDGATDGRDNAGCGPMKSDPEHGSMSAKRLGPIDRFLFRRNVNAYKEYNFPGISYDEMDCVDFLSPFVHRFDLQWRQEMHSSSCGTTSESTGGCCHEEGCSNSDGIIFETLYPLAKAQIEVGMGHSVCTWINPPPSPDVYPMLLDLRPVPYQPSDWTAVIALQQTIMNLVPNALQWNEIVVAAPKHMKDVVEAVIYYEDPDDDTASPFERARKQAELLGGVPLLKVNSMSPSAQDPLFVCATDTRNSSGDTIGAESGSNHFPIAKDKRSLTREDPVLGPTRRRRTRWDRANKQGAPIFLRNGMDALGRG